jgi:hypothetical protein
MGDGAATGSTNTAVGYAALYSITSGTDNLALGRDAGRTGSPGGQVTTGDKGIFVGDEKPSKNYPQRTMLLKHGLRP